MKYALLIPTILSAVPLSGCVESVPAGDFCDVASPALFSSQDVISFLNDNDPEHLRADLALNEYGLHHCPRAWRRR